MKHSINKIRVGVIAIIIIIAFIFNLIHLYKMQVVDKSLYQKKATAVSSRSTPIRAPRGEIYDRNYDIPYVDNTESFTVLVNPASVGKNNYNFIISKLASILGISESYVEAKLPKSIRRSYNNIEIMSSVSYDQIITIAEHIDELPGVLWESIPIRNYQFKGSISHILGYVGKISQSELQLLFNDGYIAGDNIGKNGVEKHYDKILKGEKGVKFKTVDVQGRKLDKKNIKKDINPKSGKTLVLTIDRKIQELAEKSLGKRKGSIIVLRPHNGEIVAMVSYPWYEPADFYDPSRNAFGEILLDENKPLLNRAIMGYAPASTFKVVMSAAILQEEAVLLDHSVECTGRIFYGDRHFHCWNRAGHGTLDLGGALENSCNIFYFTVGRDYLGIEKINSYALDFGFSQKTGIDLPNEHSGQFPTPEWTKRRYDVFWTGGDTMNVSIGQGKTLATPLQVANEVAFILNKGVVYKPHVVKEICDPVTKNTIQATPKEVLIKRSYDNKVYDYIKKYMRRVVTDGTAKNTFNHNIVEIAGKTGTAQVGLKEKFHDWFISYGPYDAKPEDQYIVVTMIEASNEIDRWRPWAPKATSLVYEGIFANLTYQEVVDKLKPYYLREVWQ